MAITLLDSVSEIISNGDNAHHFREFAGEAIMYVAAWLNEEGFRQAANVLQSEVLDQLLSGKD